MPDDSSGLQPFDVYSDGFTVTITPFGANISFELNPAHPSAGQVTAPRRLGTVRMSTEHLKTVVWIARRQILQSEGQLGTRAEVPRDILGQLNIPPEDWESFWSPPTPNF